MSSKDIASGLEKNKPDKSPQDPSQDKSSHGATRMSPAASQPMSVSRRRAYVSGNHLLSFEVTSASDSWTGGSEVRRPRGPRPGLSFTKERFIHANFRFLAQRGNNDIEKDQKNYSDPDVCLEWSDIELVVVPAQKDVSCPICLDRPLVPQLTKCGHYFCWPCILRYAAATSSAGSGNWRKCPICFESVNTKQLKSVHFDEVNDFTATPAELSQIGIPMVLLEIKAGSSRPRPVERASKDEGPPRCLGDLSPFDKITFVDRAFIAENIVDVEMRELEDRLAMMADEDPDKVYFELAMTMIDDRRTALFALQEEEQVGPTKGKNKSGSSSASSSSPTSTLKDSQNATIVSAFFHQSLDGQPFFLSPLSIEMAVMTEDIRKRHRYLRHIPLGCQFGLCELDLTGVVSAQVLAEFAVERETRAAARKHKAAKEAKMAAAALRREKQKLHKLELEYRAESPHEPGVATGIFGGASFQGDYETNFPLPGSDPLPTGEAVSESLPEKATEGIPIQTATRRASLPLAGSFASIAAASSPNEGFLIVGSAAGTGSATSPPSSFVDFSSLEEIVGLGSTDSVSSRKSGSGGGKKRIVLASNSVQRRS